MILDVPEGGGLRLRCRDPPGVGLLRGDDPARNARPPPRDDHLRRAPARARGRRRDGLLGRAARRHRKPRHARRHLPPADRRRLLDRALRRDDRPRSLARAVRLGDRDHVPLRPRLAGVPLRARRSGSGPRGALEHAVPGDRPQPDPDLARVRARQARAAADASAASGWRGSRSLASATGSSRRPLPAARPSRRGAVSLHPADGAACRDPRRDRARGIRGAAAQAVVAPDPLRVEVRGRRPEQPAAHVPDRGAARADPRPERSHAGDERGLDSRRRRPVRPAEAGPLRGDEAAVHGAERAAAQAARPPGAGDEEPAHARDDAGRRPRGPGRVPEGARDRVPGREDRRHLPAEVQHRGAPRPRARLRRRDLPGAALRLQEALQELPDGEREGGERPLPGRPGRRGRGGAELRQVPARALGRRAPAGQFRRRQGRDTQDHAGAAGRLPDPADDRHLAAARGRAGAPVRHQPRAPGRPLAGERRRDRSDEPVQRRDPRDGVLADLQAEHLRRDDAIRRSSRRSSTLPPRRRTTTPGSTGSPRASIRPARRSSRLRRWRRCRSA